MWRAIATDELVYHIDQNVQAPVRMALRFGDPLYSFGQAVHSFDEADFGLGQASLEIGNCAYRGSQGGDRRFQSGEAHVVLGGCCLKMGLGVQDELDGLCNVHEPDYNSLPLKALLARIGPGVVVTDSAFCPWAYGRPFMNEPLNYRSFSRQPDSRREALQIAES